MRRVYVCARARRLVVGGYVTVTGAVDILLHKDSRTRTQAGALITYSYSYSYSHYSLSLCVHYTHTLAYTYVYNGTACCDAAHTAHCALHTY